MTVQKLIFSLALCGLGVGASHAITYGSECKESIYVQPDGTRLGPFGILYFNVRGNNSGANACYAVCSFDTNTFLFPDGNPDVTGLKLKLTTFTQSYSADGDVDAWLLTNTDVSINQDDDLPEIGVLRSPLLFDAGSLPGGYGVQFTEPFYQQYPLGVFQYRKSHGENSIRSLSLPMSAEIKAYIEQQISLRLPIRFAFTPASNSVAATYAGYAKFDRNGPVLEVTTDGTATGQIKGQVVLQGYKSDQSDQRLTIILENLDGTEAQRYTRVFQLPDGTFSVQNIVAGQYKIFVKGQRWLRKLGGTYTLGASDTTLPKLTLAGGDADDNNAVGTDDYLILNAAFDTQPGDLAYDPRADFTGDFYVGSDDYLVLNASFDQLGD